METKKAVRCLKSQIGCYVIVMLAAAWCEAETKQINVSYISEPARGFPESVAVIELRPPEYLNRENDGGIMWDVQDRSLDALTMRIQRGLREAGMNITVYYRKDNSTTDTADTQELFDGADRDEQMRAKQYSHHPDTIIVARIKVDFSKESLAEEVPFHERFVKGVARSATSCLPIIGGGVSGQIDNPHYRLREVTRVNVGCNLHMTRLNHEELASYDREFFRIDTTDPSTLGFGYDGTKAYQVPSIRQIIERLLNDHVEEFLSELVPTKMTISEQVDHVTRFSAEAINCLNRRDLEAAKMLAWRAWEVENRKDHAAAFTLGVIHQVRRDWQGARTWYSRAVELKKHDLKYQEYLARANFLKVGETTNNSGGTNRATSNGESVRVPIAVHPANAARS